MIQCGRHGSSGTDELSWNRSFTLPNMPQFDKMGSIDSFTNLASDQRFRSPKRPRGFWAWLWRKQLSVRASKNHALEFEAYHVSGNRWNASLRSNESQVINSDPRSLCLIFSERIHQMTHATHTPQNFRWTRNIAIIERRHPSFWFRCPHWAFRVFLFRFKSNCNWPWFLYSILVYTAHIPLKFMGLSPSLFWGRHWRHCSKEKSILKKPLEKNPHDSVGCRQLLLGHSIEADLPTDAQAARKSCLVPAEPVDSVTILWQEEMNSSISSITSWWHEVYVVDVVDTRGYTIGLYGNYLTKKASHGQKKLDSCMGCDR